MTEHSKFPKMVRLENLMVSITEKLDGTNGVIYIDSASDTFLVGSRNKWVGPGKEDNMGFYAFCMENKETLLKLGDGWHYGEFIGKGIQRSYGLDHKRFYLFNPPRYHYFEETEVVRKVPMLCEKTDLKEIIFHADLGKLDFIQSTINPDYKMEGVVLRFLDFDRLVKVIWDKPR